MANILGKLFNDIANSIRNKTGNTETIKPIDFPAQIDSITGGGAEGCVIVTFMNGGEVSLTRPVYIGDDCPDPVTQGRIETPTKESTVDTVYTHSGWSLTDGGSADTNSLSNVTEDRTVYATYTSSVRYYTITYYDEDGTTVLHTEQVAYGSLPSYTPTKDGAAFKEWTPTPTAVTGNASYIASWDSVIASGTCGWDATWVLNADGTLIISGTGSTHIYGSTSVPWNAYKSQITKADVQEGITDLGIVFSDLANVTSITMPSSATRIRTGFIYKCPLLTSITIPSGVIDKNAINTCENLTNVTLGANVTSISADNFILCDKLTNISVHEDNEFYCDIDGILHSKDKQTLIKYPSAKAVGDIELQVSHIGSHAFKVCKNLTSYGGAPLISIAENAFVECTSFTGFRNAETISGVTSIGKSAFSWCTNLSNFTIPKNVTVLEQYVFNKCPITSITIHDGITTIKSGAFSSTSLTTAIFEDTEGWVAGDTSLSSSDLADSTTAATYLKTTYVGKTWTKS